jgi:uncharacterized membrane protein YphA (DoxX/SURF4 family)
LLSAVGPGTGLGYATGVGSVAAGVAILTGVQARLAAILVSTMLASFALLVHQPTLLADHSIHMNWTESAVNLAVIWRRLGGGALAGAAEALEHFRID